MPRFKYISNWSLLHKNTWANDWWASEFNEWFYFENVVAITKNPFIKGYWTSVNVFFWNRNDDCFGVSCDIELWQCHFFSSRYSFKGEYLFPNKWAIPSFKHLICKNFPVQMCMSWCCVWIRNCITFAPRFLSLRLQSPQRCALQSCLVKTALCCASDNMHTNYLRNYVQYIILKASKSIQKRANK